VREGGGKESEGIGCVYKLLKDSSHYFNACCQPGFFSNRVLSMYCEVRSNCICMQG